MTKAKNAKSVKAGKAARSATTGKAPTRVAKTARSVKAGRSVKASAKTVRKADATTGAPRAAAAEKRYPKFYQQARPIALAASRSTVQAPASAVQSPDTIAGLRRFVKKHQPADQEYQDAFHRNRVRAAQYELMRLEYLNGNVKAGDKLLAQLQDLDR